jgi:hypothetical protein
MSRCRCRSRAYLLLADGAVVLHDGHHAVSKELLDLEHQRAVGAKDGLPDLDRRGKVLSRGRGADGKGNEREKQARKLVSE